MKILSKSIYLLLAVALSLSTLTGCEEKSPMEKAGESIEEAGDSLQEAANDTQRALEDAAD